MDRDLHLRSPTAEAYLFLKPKKNLLKTQKASELKIIKKKREGFRMIP
jgi:hypothetical protein